jgi:hypothetical protein
LVDRCADAMAKVFDSQFIGNQAVDSLLFAISSPGVK